MFWSGVFLFLPFFGAGVCVSCAWFVFVMVLLVCNWCLYVWLVWLVAFSRDCFGSSIACVCIISDAQLDMHWCFSYVVVGSLYTVMP